MNILIIFRVIMAQWTKSNIHADDYVKRIWMKTLIAKSVLDYDFNWSYRKSEMELKGISLSTFGQVFWLWPSFPPLALHPISTITVKFLLINYQKKAEWKKTRVNGAD